MTPVIISTIIAIFMGVSVSIIRMKAAQKPMSLKKIILPPFFMSTGALMYIFPFFRITWLEMLEAGIAGVIFSAVLIWTTKFEVKNKEIYLINNRSFLYLLLLLLAIRVIAKIILSSTIDVGSLSGMFWFLAFCMIVPWRASMYFTYKKMLKELDRTSPII